ncbi:MAG: ribosomal L7Ae/L30e/S12e/Gadd45 family protein [Clostridia bacterium]|nr:ribosomal L7Ae/L30e/S12e/Gadd45 family protein [Clostridia bacterium]
MHKQLEKSKQRVAGVRQVMKGIGEGNLRVVFLALDASPMLQAQVRAAANERQLPVETVSSMEELGQMCGIDVPCAVAALKKQDT